MRGRFFSAVENIPNTNWIFTEMVQYSTNPIITRTWDFTNGFIDFEGFRVRVVDEGGGLGLGWWVRVRVMV